MSVVTSIKEAVNELSLQDILIMIVCFKVVNPVIMKLSIFRETDFGRYIAAVISLLVVPLCFNQRTPSVSHFFDSGDSWILKILVLIVLAKVVVDQPKPTVNIVESVKNISR
jgi:hypothetical protein